MEKDPILEFTKAAETQAKANLKKSLEKQAADDLFNSLQEPQEKTAAAACPYKNKLKKLVKKENKK